VVDAPTFSAKTYDSITVTAVNAPGNGQSVEYARNTTNAAPSIGWQDGTTFTGLSAGTTYYIFARSKESANYNAGAASSLAVTTLQNVSSNDVFYWVDEHGALLITDGGNLSIGVGERLTITAQSAGYTVVNWTLNNTDTGLTGNAYVFSSTAAGTYKIGLLVSNGGSLYNTTITITVTNN